MRLCLDYRSCGLLVVLSVPLLLFFPRVSDAADENGQYLVTGLGNASCRTYLSDGKKGQTYYMAWLSGYITRHNQKAYLTYSVAGKKTYAGITQWLNDYCTTHPSDTFERAADKLLTHMHYFRFKSKPEWLEKGSRK